MAKDNDSKLLNVLIVVCIMFVLVSIFFFVTLYRQPSATHDGIEDFIYHLDKINVGPVIMGEKTTLENSMIVLQDANCDITIEGNDCIIRNCSFYDASQYNIDKIIDMGEYLDEVHYYSIEYWPNYLLWEIEIVGIKNDVEYKIKVNKEEDLNTAIDKFCAKVKQTLEGKNGGIKESMETRNGSGLYF